MSFLRQSNSNLDTLLGRLLLESPNAPNHATLTVLEQDNQMDIQIKTYPEESFDIMLFQELSHPIDILRPLSLKGPN